VRREWRIHHEDLVCGVVGRLVREKGIAELIDVVEQLHESHPVVKFVFVGPSDPGKRDAVDDATLAHASGAGAIFTGERTDMPECYAAMDVFVTASWREGFPRSAMEAAAMGLPAIGTDIRGNRQVIDDGVTGILVPVRDPVALATAIRRLAADGPTRRLMATAARRRAIDEFDQRDVIDRTLAAYRCGR
jgi:glycosyltransferase involved in cell wall biosynthesis